jgi:hypothetical protein
VVLAVCMSASGRMPPTFSGAHPVYSQERRVARLNSGLLAGFARSVLQISLPLLPDGGGGRGETIHGLSHPRRSDALPASESSAILDGPSGWRRPCQTRARRNRAAASGLWPPLRRAGSQTVAGATMREDRTIGGGPMKAAGHFGVLLPPEGASGARIALADQGQVP